MHCGASDECDEFEEAVEGRRREFALLAHKQEYELVDYKVVGDLLRVASSPGL